MKTVMLPLGSSKQDLFQVFFCFSFGGTEREPSQWGTLGTFIILSFNLSLSLFSFQRPLFVLADRNLDLATPLHHTWTYQALIHDVLVRLTGHRERERAEQICLLYFRHNVMMDLTDTSYTLTKTKGLLMRNVHATVWTHSW